VNHGMMRRAFFFLAVAAFALGPLGVPIAGTIPSNQTETIIRAESIDHALTDRGLLGNAIRTGRVHPPSGVEVDDTVETADRGTVISRTQAWSETLDGQLLRIELTDYPSRQYQVAFWLMESNSSGCAIFGRTMYSEDGRSLKSEFWRNDRELRITGAADFPNNLYPSAVPAIAMSRALNPMHQGAAGIVSTQITPYGYVDLQVVVTKSEQISVPAGKFAAFRVDSQADVAKLLPSWPHMLLHLVTPFVPGTTYYFEARPPYRFLKKEQAGSPFVGGPEATTELVRYYTSGNGNDAAQGTGAGGESRVIAQLSGR
jgi:hypothetical protein